jgi:hypothetical protein
MLRNPHLKSSRIFLFLTLIATLTGLVDFLMITAPNEGTALAVAHPLVFLSVLLAATMFYLTSYLPYERERSWLVRHKREFVVLAVFTALVPAVFIGTVAEDQYGWWISMSLPVVWWYATIYVFYLAGTITMVGLYRNEEREDVKHRIIPPTVAMMLPIILDAFLTVLLMSGQTVPPDLSLALLASSILFVYGIFKQKLFVLKPVKEERRADRPASFMRPGQCVLVEAMTDHAYTMFANELASSGQGVLITRARPEQIAERYGLQGTPVLWLTDKPGPDSIDPSSINVLMHTTLQFLRKSNGSVVLLDGLDYLRLFNRPQEVMQLLYGLRDAAIVTGSKLIVTVNPEGLGERELPLMERELEPIRP